MEEFSIKKHRTLIFKLSFFVGLMFIGNLAFAQTVDCSVSGNCNDAFCNYAANIERGCRCFDGIDNDGDGKIDKADSNCATYYGLTFVGEGSDCSIVPPGANTPYDLVNAPITSDQNTADTQSKISVGDVDGDGDPDAVITSKWNAEMRVVATTGSSAGDVISDFKVTGQGAKIFSGSGDCSPKNLLFEHENLIADIDGDKKAELFGVVSNRKGNPDSPPSCFFLVGFKYAPASLVPLYDAVQIGTDRPGTFGIADMDGDGKAELYLRDRIYAAETGKLLATANGNWDLDVTSAPVAVNISGDNKMELVCGTKIFSIPATGFTNRSPASPATLTVLHDMNTIGSLKAYVKLAEDPIEYGTDTHSSCSVADIDEDGNIDVIISGSLGDATTSPATTVKGLTTVFYWNVAKNRVTYFSPPDATYPSGWPWGTGRVNIGDPNGDGKLELTFIAGNRLWCMKTDPTTGVFSNAWASYRTINDTRSGVLTVTIYDFDNDNKPEIAYRDSQQLAVIDGVAGTTLEWSAVCQSHTYTEGPIIADVNGDGGTDICVPCNTNNSFDINDGIQQQALGQFRLYYSTGNEWLPTRKVWNQPGYFVVNINDDLTLPFPQLDQTIVFGTGNCPNGAPGPQQPLNVFLNQVPNLSANGCPVFPAPDLSFIGDTPNTLCEADPTQPGCDDDGNGVYEPTVEVIPPICGDLAIQVRFNIVNDGDLPISGNIPVSFWKADPTLATTTQADKLFSSTLTLANLAVDATYQSPFLTFNGTGGSFTLYIVLNNAGATLPIVLTGASSTECRIDNNMYSVPIVPDPFITTVEKVKDNFKCDPAAADNGELRLRIYKGSVSAATEVTDYTPYAFQWYTGAAGSPGPAMAGKTQYNLTGLNAGDYTVRVQNTQKGCFGDYVSGNIINTIISPSVKIDTIRQTKCSPPNGELHATVLDPGGNTGYTFSWVDVGLNPLGITGADALNMSAGNYKVIVSKSGCDKTIDAPPLLGPKIPDATASVLQNVVDCVNPNSGSITASAVFSGVAQNPANYTFNWFYYDMTTFTRGTILPAANGVGETRTGLPVGWYEVEITDNITLCKANQTPEVQVTSQTVLPVASISQVAPQTSCDPNQPNGILQASGVAGSFVNPTDFTFEWFRGDNTLAANKIPIAGGPETVSGAKGEILNNAKGGGVIYTVRITTPLNCSDTEKRVLTEDVKVPVLTISQLTPNSVCDATKASNPYNGSIQATVTFGVDGSNNPISVTLPDPKYTFTWYDGTTTTTLHNPVPANLQNPVLTGLKDGDYAAIVERTDLHCPSIPKTTPVGKTTINPILLPTSTGSNNCDPALTPDGTVTVTVTNTGASPGPFTYKWYDGNAVGVNPLGAANNGTSATAINVGGPTGAPRTYTVEVLNTATGCSNNTSQFVADNSVVPVLATATTDNTMCDPTKFNGTMKVSLANPVGTYVYPTDFTFTWYKDATNNPVNQIGAPVTTTDLVLKTITLTKLQEGPYTVEAKNTKTGCKSAPANNNVGNGKILPTVVPGSTGSNNCDPAMTPDGTATVTVSGTAGPYSFQWYTGSGNPATLPIINGATTQTILNVGGPNKPVGSAPHSYTVLVTDTGTGCPNFTTASVPDNSVVPVLGTSTTPNSICAPSTSVNGTMIVSLTNPVGTYVYPTDFTFTWYDANTNDPTKVIGAPSTTTDLVAKTITLTTLKENPYTVEALNTKTGCKSLPANNTVGNAKLFPQLAPASKGSHNCKVDAVNGINNDGEASVVASGTTGGYSYQWYTGSGDPATLTPINGATSSILSGVGGPNVPAGSAPHFYTVLVTDIATQCPAYTTSSVADLSVNPILSTTATPNTICAPSTSFDGSVQVSLGNAQALGVFPADYDFKWYDANTNNPADEIMSPATTTTATTITMITLEVGDYTVVGYNKKTGCTSDPASNQVANGKVNPDVTVLTTGSRICTTGAGITPDGTATGTINNLGAGVGQVDGPFTIQWYDDAVVNPAKLHGAAITGHTLATTTINNIGGPDTDPAAPFTYTVHVKDELSGCFAIASGIVADISEKPTFTLTAFDNHVCDKNKITSGPQQFDGHVDITAITHEGVAFGGAVTYAWRNVDLVTDLPTGGVIGTAATLTLLDAKKYSATVTIPSLGCTSDPEIAEVIDDFPVFVITPSIVNNTNCPGGGINANGSAAVGSITEDAVGGTLTDFDYKWYDGAVVDPGNIRAENSDIGPVQIKGPETFTVEMTKKTTGCSASQPMTVTDVKVTPTISVAVIQDNKNCTGTPNGIVEATPANQGATFSITWTGGGGTALIATNTLANDRYTQLAAGGPYAAKVKNTVTGCESAEDSKNIVDDFTYPVITFPTNTDQTSCGAPNGVLEALADGVTAGRTFEWFTGIGTGSSLAVDGGDPVNRIDDLASNDYTLRVTIDATGCSAMESPFVAETLTFPDISLAVASHFSSCASPNGEVAPTINNASGNFTIFYVFTDKGGTPPIDPDDVENTPTTTRNNLTNFAGLKPGFATAVVVNNTTSCRSNITTEQIQDLTADYNLTMDNILAGGNCTDPGGGADVNITGGSGMYNYDWRKGLPTNTTPLSAPINFYEPAFFPKFAGTQPTLSTTDKVGSLLLPVADMSLTAGAYTVVVTDQANGCGEVFTINIPFVGLPNVVVDPTDLTRCDTDNGEIEVEVTDPLGTNTDGYRIKFFSGLAPVLGNKIGADEDGLSVLTRNRTGLAEGDYYIEVYDKTPANIGCPLGFTVSLETLPLAPLVSINDIDPNTSCDPANDADGKVDILVETQAGDATAKAYRLTSINPLPLSLVAQPNTPIGTGVSGQTTGLIDGFKPQSEQPVYTIRVTDFNSGCFTDFPVSFQDQQVVPSDLALNITPETLCSNALPLALSSDGKAVASLNDGEPVTHFNFTWDNDATLGTPVFGPSVGTGAVTGGQEINRTNATAANWPMGATLGVGNGNRTYYVQAERIDWGPGATGVGCKTSIVQVVIPDDHVSPDMTLKPIFDSFCLADAANNDKGDGKIEVVADANPSTVAQDIPAAGFSYSWNPVPLTTAASPVVSMAAGTHTIIELHDGNYTVTATNVTNQCIVTNSVSIDPAPYVLTITDFDVTNQRICNSDGLIEITEVTLTDNSAGPDVVDPSAGLNAQYDFEWYTDATLPAAGKLRDGAGGAGALIVDKILSNDADKDLTTNEAGDYQAMVADSYYVVAVRSDNTRPGFGCPTLPIKIDIEDKHINPEPDLEILSNTSCLPAGPGEGEIILTVTDNTALPFNGGNYTYTFVAPGPMPSAGPGANPNVNGSVGDGDGIGNDDDFVELLDNAAAYTIAVKNNTTGCVVNTFATIIKNATPVFVQDVDLTDEINCFATGDGSITVTKVTLNDRNGASQEFVTAPILPQGSISDFDFHWTKSGDAFTQVTTGAGGNILNSTTYDATAPGFSTLIGAGTYTVLAERKTGVPGAGCKSAPFQVVIQNKKINPVVTLTPFSNTSCNNVFEGEIKVNVVDATTATPPGGGFRFNYNWTASATPALTAGNPYNTNDGDGFGGGDDEDPGAGVVIDNDFDHPRQLSDGNYTVRVTNPTTQCFSDKSTVVIKNAAPVFVQAATVVDQVICNPDGSITVDLVSVDDRTGVSTNFTTTTPNNPAQTMLTDFQFEWKRVGDANNAVLITNGAAAPAGATLNATTYAMGGFAPAFGIGTYTVTARRKAGSPGANCTSAPYTVVIQDKRIYPVVQLTPFANTSCSNNIVDFEGAIEVNVTDANPRITSANPFLYNWTTSATPTVINGAVGSNSDGDGFGGGDDQDPGAGVVIDNDHDHPQNLMEGNYAITVTNVDTNCPTTGSTTIFQNSTPVITQLVTATDQIMCLNDGKLQVNEVKVIDRDGNELNSTLPATDPNYLDIADFDFEWYRGGTAAGNQIATGDGALGNVSGGTILDEPFYNNIGFDAYYVVTRRMNGAPGKNCPSAPYKIDIQDRRVYPSVALTPFANTSCDPTFFEGEIRIKVSDATSIAAPVGGFLFDYTWTASATPVTLPVNSTSVGDGDSFGGPMPGENDGSGIDADGDRVTALKENDPNTPALAFYTVQVENQTTGCTAIGSTQIFKNSTPVFTQLVIPTDQVVCNPDGMLQVQEVQVIDRDGNIESNLNGDFPLSDFAFSYDRTTIGNTVVDNSHAAQPVVQLDNTVYANIGFDTYYVVATRVNNGPGLNCSSAPYKVDIGDARLFPKVAFSSVANSSCSDLKPNGALMATASEQDNTTDNYTFTWTLDGGALAPTSVVNNASPSSTVTNALDGAYVVTATNTVTGCPFDASFNLALDQTRSTPNIIEVQTIDPLDCNPTAQAEVTKITLGSQTNSTLFPPQVPPNNEVSGASLLAFNYLWFQGDPANPANQFPIGGPFVTTPCVGPGCATPTTGLTPGKYYVFVQDPTTDCQSDPREVVINDDDIVYPVVIINQTKLQISCPITNGTGELSARADGQVSPHPNYTFEWFQNLTGTGSVIGNNSVLTNLIEGDYSVTATNLTTSCSTTEIFIVRNQSAEFLPKLSLSTQPRTNCLVPDGTLLAREVGYDPNSEYPFDPPSFDTELYVGAKANVDVTQPGAPMPSTFSLVWTQTGLDIGPYTVKIIDNNTGCETVEEVTLNDNRVAPVIVIKEENPLINCDPARPNGQLAATADNGLVGGYTFDWYNGSTVSGAILQTSNILIGVQLGSFTVRATNDATGCFADKTGTVTDGRFYPPSPDASVVQHRTHCKVPDGWVTASVDGVILNYSFDWYDGPDDSGAPDFNGVNYTGRDIGPHTVTATDVITGCTSEPTTVEVLDETIVPTMEFLATPSFCEDLPSEIRRGSGTIQVQLLPAGVLTDSVAWVNLLDGTVAGNGSYITDLYPGFYRADVETVKGCVASDTAEVKTEVLAYNLVTTNGDQKNDKFVIDCISRFPNNNVKIFNRAGVKVYEADGYNNDDKVFSGVGEMGVYTTGNNLPVGTYFYVIDKRDGSKPRTGYLELVK